MALGAQRSAIMRLVLGRSIAWAAAGIALGIVGAAVLTRYLQTLLFGLTPLDPATFAAGALMLSAFAALASYVPARRATAVEPVVALRHE
jgi:ABC-type antimicrobial peptide transport system permease subunit